MSEIKVKSLESWIWDAACSIRGAKDAPKYKDYILPLIFTKRLCDVFDDELNRIAKEVGSRKKAFQLAKADHKLVRFYLPLIPDDPEQPVWSVIRKLSDKIGEGVTTHMRSIARENPLLQGIIDRVDFNATTHGQRDLDDDRLSNLIEAVSTKRLGLDDVEADIIGKSYEYLIRKFAEGGGQSAGEFYTPPEVGTIMSRVLQPEPGMEIYDPTCGSGGLLVKCEIAMEEQSKGKKRTVAPLKLYGQEFTPETWAMANMNMIIHDMEGQIEIGDTFKNPKFRTKDGKLRTFDRVVANPMWNQDWFTEADYDADELGRFPAGAGFPGKSSADWGWVQHICASLNDNGRAAVVLDTGAASRGSGNAGTNKEKTVRQWFVDQDLIESVLYLPENLFYNTTAPGVVLFLNKAKAKARQGKVFLVNASQVFEKGDPKNFIPEAGIQRLADTLIGWKEEEKLSRIVDLAGLKKNDYNVLPSRYIHTSEAETYRPIAEIVEELKVIEADSQEADKKLKKILEKLGGMSEWHTKPVKEIGEIITGRTPSTARRDFYDGDYNLISPADLDNGKYVRSSHKTLTKLGFEQCRALPKGTVLVGCIGNVGKLGIVGNDQSATNQQINALICNHEHDNEFVYYSFHENRVKLEKLAVKTTVPILNKTSFGNFEVRVPRLPEQRKIAHILSTVQRAIEAQERIIQTTTELKKVLMHKLFTEGLRNEPQKQTEIGPIPESWEVVELGEFFQIKHGYAFNGEFFKQAGDYILMTPGHFHEEGGFRDQGEKTKFFTGDIPRDYVLAKDDLVVAMTEQKSGLLGSAAFVPEGNRYLHNQRLGLICDLDTKRLSKRYLFHVFNLPHLRVEVAKTSTGSKVKHTSPTKLRAVKVGIPPIVDEQEEIASAISATQQKINAAANKKTQLQDLFRTLLHELMTAKACVHEQELTL